jgi:hypothetical protein
MIVRAHQQAAGGKGEIRPLAAPAAAWPARPRSSWPAGPAGGAPDLLPGPTGTSGKNGIWPDAASASPGRSGASPPAARRPPATTSPSLPSPGSGECPQGLPQFHAACHDRQPRALRVDMAVQQAASPGRSGRPFVQGSRETTEPVWHAMTRPCSSALLTAAISGGRARPSWGGRRRRANRIGGARWRSIEKGEAADRYGSPFNRVLAPVEVPVGRHHVRAA